jgi:hypothetical protein
MLLLLWGTCWVISVAIMLFELIRPGRGRYRCVIEASVMVVATGGVLNYLLSGLPALAHPGLRATADVIQLAGAVGVIFFSLRRLRAAPRDRTLRERDHSVIQ